MDIFHLNIRSDDRREEYISTAQTVAVKEAVLDDLDENIELPPLLQMPVIA